MALTTNEAESITFASQLRPDKIIYRAEATYTVPAATTINDYHEFSFEHGLPQAPLLLGNYSDDGFATCHDFGHGPYGPLSLFGYSGNQLMAHVWSTDTHVHIRAISHNQLRSVTFRIIGLKRELSDTPPIAVTSPATQDDLLFTTDENTLKLIAWGSVTVNIVGGSSPTINLYSVSGDHALIPICFQYYDEKWSYMNTMRSIGSHPINMSIQTRPGRLRLNLQSNSDQTVTVYLKAYLNA